MGISQALGSAGQIPVGTLVPFAGVAAPANWLFCAGQAISRTTFSGLFLTIGTTYGTGDGSTTFNLPDLRGRVPAGKDDMNGTPANRLTSGGSGINGVVLNASGGSQNHTLTSTEMPSHTHTQNAHTHTQNPHFHYLGGGQSFGTFFGGNPGGFATFALQVQAINQSTYQGAYIATDSTATNQNTTATNQNTGGSGSHQNTQPTIVLNYIIRAV